jgi:hypothetical protein
MPTLLKEHLFAPSRTLPPAPSTGFSNPGCYLRFQRDCSEKISLEHFAPRALLAQIAPKLSVGGLPGTGGREVLVSTDKVGAKILCTRHNSSLSPLDAAMSGFFRLIQGLFASPTCDTQYVLRGADVELSLLKMLLSLRSTYRGVASTETDYGTWLPVLLGLAPWPTGTGLYFFRPENDLTSISQPEAGYVSMDFQPAALDVAFCGVVLGLRLKDCRADSRARHRLRVIEFQGPEASTYLDFAWPDKACHQATTLRWSGRRTGPHPFAESAERS